MVQQSIIEYNEVYIKKIIEIKASMYQKYLNISNEDTPKFDGRGMEIVRKRDNQDYIIESHMRAKLNKYFPGWSWQDGQIYPLGSEWLIVSGHLLIIDEHLLAFGIMPPVRKYFGCGASRIQYKKDMPHTAENVVDIDKNIKSANTNAFKVAINRLCCIGDDIYAKRIDEEGAGSLEDVIVSTPDKSTEYNLFLKFVSEHQIKPYELVQTLGMDLTQITDYSDAYKRIKAAKNIQ